MCMLSKCFVQRRVCDEREGERQIRISNLPFAKLYEVICPSDEEYEVLGVMTTTMSLGEWKTALFLNVPLR